MHCIDRRLANASDPATAVREVRTDEFGKSYEALTAEQKKQAQYKVIESSGRDNAKFTKDTDRLHIMGKVAILVTTAFATYETLNTDNKVKKTTRQGITTMRRLNKLLLCSITLVASLATGLYLNAKESQMPKKIMMYYGGFEVEEMFDASQWFVSGMYKPRNIEADGGASNVTMLHSQLRPFTPEQLAELPYVAAEAFDSSYLEDTDTQALILNPPDLSHRIRYTYSAFAEPNKPKDYYLYCELDGRKFAILFARDALTGNDLTGKDAKEISGDYASQADHRKAFAEIAELERKAR